MDLNKIADIIKRLKRQYPVVATRLEYGTPFQLLIATILAAQCNDEQVNRVTRHLFAHYPGPAELAGAKMERIKKIIFSTGFYNNKARHIKACAIKIQEEFGGKVPHQIELLVSLPGVGRKTANVVRSVCFGIQTIVVDTHVHRVSRRLNLSGAKDPARVESDLMSILPEPVWNDVSLQLIYLGREFCDARKPRCSACILFDLCPTRGR